MAYLGREPAVGRYALIDDISSQFNGSETSFVVKVGGDPVSIVSDAQLLVSLGGVLQKPGTDFNIAPNGGSLTFTTAPENGDPFFGILFGDTLNVGVPSDGTIDGRHLKNSLSFSGKTVSGGTFTGITLQSIGALADFDGDITTDKVSANTVHVAKKLTSNVSGTNILTTQGPITTPKITANVVHGTAANFTTLQADSIDFDGDLTVDKVTANTIHTTVKITANTLGTNIMTAAGPITAAKVSANSFSKIVTAGPITTPSLTANTITADGGLSIDNITIDGTEIDLSSGDLTIDVAGDIILDADGADVKLSDGGTNFLTFTKSSDNVSINTPISDGDISFVGNDGGSSVTAMTFDMSAGGAVTIDPNNGLAVATGANAKLNVGSLSGTAAALNVNVAGSDGAGAYRLINATDGVTTNFVVKTDNSASANKVMLGPETSSNLVLYIGAGEHIVIDSSGHVTKPNNTAFSVHKNGTDESNLGINSNHKMQWSTERFDVNSDFDIGNNQFVAPVTGKYFLSCTARAEQMDISASYILWTLITSNQTYHTIHDPARDFTADSSLGPTLHVSLVVDMDANDTAYMQFHQAGGANQTDIDGDAQFTYFSGFLIG